MQAVNSSFMGVTCRTEVNENTQKLKFSFWAKASSDYSGQRRKDTCGHIQKRYLRDKVLGV